MTIYLVATIHCIDEHGLAGTRTVGYFETLADAKKAIEKNSCDLSEEGYYKYAVIEDVLPGIYMSILSNPIFYEWDGEKYVKIDRPKNAEYFAGFTIG